MTVRAKVQEQIENPLGELFEHFASGRIDSFLAGCAKEMILTARGVTYGATTVRRNEFPVWLASMDALAGGTMKTEVCLTFTSETENVVVLRHALTRDGVRRTYETVNRCTFANGLLRGWFSQPMNVADYCTAWGTWEPARSHAS